MPRKMIKSVGIKEAIGLLVLVAGMDYMMTLKDQKQTTTFLNCMNSTTGKNVNGVK